MKREEEKRLIIENQKRERKKEKSLNQSAQINNSQNGNNDENNNSNAKNSLNQILKDMCDYGNIIKKEIEIDKKSEEKEFIYSNEIKDSSPSSDEDMFALNLLSQNLESNGIQTVISKKNNDEEESITNLQFITNGLYYKKKYVLKFDFGDEKTKNYWKKETNIMIL